MNMDGSTVSKDAMIGFNYQENGNISKNKNISMLAENLTGLKPEDPRMVDFLISDAERIREKYGLPDTMLVSTDPKEYGKQLVSVLEKNNIGWFTKSTVGPFFDKHPDTYAAYFPDIKGIGINVNKQKDADYNDNVYYVSLTHEIIHALQDQRGKTMSIEQKEYEANVVSLPMNFLKLDSNSHNDTLRVETIEKLFGGILFSVDLWNKQQQDKGK
jgi:hypothetical protein